MVVTFAVDVGAGLDERPHDLEIGRLGGVVQGRGVVAVIADVDGSAGFQQQPHARRVIAAGGRVEGGGAEPIDAAGVEQLGVRLEPRA